MPRTARLLLAALVCVAAGADEPVGYGTVRGRLVWGGDEAPATRTIIQAGDAPNDRRACAADGPIVDQSLVVDPKTMGVRWGVASLVRPSGKYPEAERVLVEREPLALVALRNCEFVPFVAAVHQDQRVVFQSFDPVAHNVRLTARVGRPFNRMLPPFESLEARLVAEPRPIGVFCDIHPWQRGHVRVFDHPFFAVTAADGSFEIAGVPAGGQNLSLWHPRAGYVFRDRGLGVRVNVSAGRTTDVGVVKLDPALLQ